MDYSRIYNELIEHARNRTTIEITEQHHIIPDCFFIKRSRSGEPGWLDGNPNDKSNLIELTLREHFIAHLLLAKIYGGKMIYAANVMSNSGKYTSRVYKWIRIAHALVISDANRGENNGMYGKTHTKEAIEGMKEKLREQITCPYCNTTGGMTIMKRWHFDNCKLSPLYVPPKKMKRIDPTAETKQKRSQKYKETMNTIGYVHPNKNREMKKDYSCIHCGMVAGKGQITRWHNNNCKKRLHLP